MAVQRLAENEIAAWDKFVNNSPQGNLFHTSLWYNMLTETDSSKFECTYLVFEKDGLLNGGLIIQKIKKTGYCKELFFGYNGPLFHSTIHYEQNSKTHLGFGIGTELLKHASNLSSRIIIKNQPEIWDTRFYNFNGWTIKTQYTKILHWPQSDEDFELTKITSQYSLLEDISNEMIIKFSTNLFQQHTQRKNILFKRIQWILSSKLGKFFMLVNKDGIVSALTMIIESNQNNALYVFGILPLIKGKDQEIYDAVIAQLFSYYRSSFNSIDVGALPITETLKVNSKIECALTPYYTATWIN